MDGTEGMDGGYVQSLLLLALGTGASNKLVGTGAWRMMVKNIASDKVVGTGV